MNGPDIETARLTLRPLLESVAANIALFVGDSRVARNLAVVPHPSFGCRTMSEALTAGIQYASLSNATQIQ